uniref:Transmembrane protein n=1 Tax=Rhabditophanes sp. KR3021 TaxID=114890 RepID=A0AC35U6M9_9BILA
MYKGQEDTSSTDSDQTANLNTLLQGYQSLAVPAHAAFNIMFTLSTILAFDNIVSKDRPFLNFLYGIVSFQLPIWSVIIWIAGSAVNLSCIRYDEKIASQSDINLDLSDHYYSELYIWKILVTIRAALTAIGCLLAAKIDKNESLSGFDNSMPTNEE